MELPPAFLLVITVVQQPGSSFLNTRSQGLGLALSLRVTLLCHSMCGSNPSRSLYLLSNFLSLSLFLSLRCIYLLSTTYDIHICLNINGTYEATPAAEVLRLSDYFSVPSEIGEAVNGYMEIHSPDFILNRAWVSCQVNTSTFTGVSYHSLLVKGVYVVTMELPRTHSPD